MQIAQLEYQLDNSILTQRTLRLRIGEADVRIFCDQEAGKLLEKLSVPGFRRGKAPLALLRKFHWKQIEPRAFAELKRAAMEQVFGRLEKADKPFIPPELLDQARIKLRYGKPLEFAMKYMVDPTGMSGNPGQPSMDSASAAGFPQIAPPIRQGAVSGPRIPGVQLPATGTNMPGANR